MRKINKIILATALSTAMAIPMTALASGSITGIIENISVDTSSATINGEAVNGEVTATFSDYSDSSYFLTEEGLSIADIVSKFNEAGPKAIDLNGYDAATEMYYVDFALDNNTNENIENIKVSFELTNLLTDRDVYVIQYDSTSGWSLNQLDVANYDTGVDGVTASSVASKLRAHVIGDSILSNLLDVPTLNGQTITLTYDKSEGAVFAVLYKTEDGSIDLTDSTVNDIDVDSNGTGDESPVIPLASGAAMAFIIAASCIGYRKVIVEKKEE